MLIPCSSHFFKNVAINFLRQIQPNYVGAKRGACWYNLKLIICAHFNPLFLSKPAQSLGYTNDEKK